MTYHWDRHEPNPIHAAEREESRAAQRFTTDCYRHNYISNRSGGGICRNCGDEIKAHEL